MMLASFQRSPPRTTKGSLVSTLRVGGEGPVDANRKRTRPSQNRFSATSGNSHSSSSNTTKSTVQQHTNYKLKNAHDRMQGSFAALLNYFAHHGDVCHQVLDELRETMEEGIVVDLESSKPSTSTSTSSGASTNRHATNNHQSFSLQQHQPRNARGDAPTAVSRTSTPRRGSFQQLTLVTALWKLHQYVECLSSAPAHETSRQLLLWTAWKSLANYLQAYQRWGGSNPHSSSRLALIQVSEAVVACQRHLLMLEKEHGETKARRCSSTQEEGAENTNTSRQQSIDQTESREPKEHSPSPLRPNDESTLVHGNVR